MQNLINLIKDIGRDVGQGKNIDAYVVTIAGLVLVVVEFLGDVPPEWQSTALLMGVTLLVFKSTRRDKEAPDLDGILLDRQSFGSFREFIRGGHELNIYSPSAVNALSSPAVIQREILDRGGKLRIILQDLSQQASIDILHQQLDEMGHHLLELDVERSMSVLRDLKRRDENVELRLLPYSPGFSLVVIDPDGKNGRAIVEFFGFTNEHITDRMHIEISRQQSQYWFEYWAAQFDTMWEAAREPAEEASS